MPIGACGVLATQEIFQPAQGAIAWVRTLQEQAKLLNLDSLELGIDRIPLSPHLWLQANNTVEIEIGSRQELTSANTDLNLFSQLIKRQRV